MTGRYKKLRVTHRSGVVTIIIENPPANVLDAALMSDLRRFLTEVRDDDAARVIVFESSSRTSLRSKLERTIQGIKIVRCIRF